MTHRFAEGIRIEAFDPAANELTIQFAPEVVTEPQRFVVLCLEKTGPLAADPLDKDRFRLAYAVLVTNGYEGDAAQEVARWLLVRED